MNKANSHIFSLPINPKVDLEFVDNIFIPFLKKHKELIYDLYFTCRIPPFTQDAMGDIFVVEPIRGTTMNALYISEKTGIPLSATFNNLYVRPDQKNLDLWIQNFKPLYDKGIKIVTLPHTSWLLTGQIQKEFPELQIKNTILREVTRPNEIVSLAQAGFYYINLDRDLMRDKNQLLAIKEAKEYCASIGKPVKLSILSNENCWGGCPIMPEHYHFNSTRNGDTPQYFADPISRVSCSTWDIKEAEKSLKAANLPPWKEDWEEMFDLGIDVFKMHGRESAMRLKESMDIIEKWSEDKEILFSNFDDYINDVNLQEKPIDIWREKIKSCKFDCWKCNYCEAVVDSRLKKQERSLHPYVKRILDSIDKSARAESNFIESSFDINGLSSNRVRHLLNNLCSYNNVNYLEVGVFNGSTFCAAIQNNDITAYACDTWEEKNIKPFRDDILWNLDEGSIDTFVDNIKRYWTNNSNVFIMNGDIRGITEENIGHKINLIFYDANHDPNIQSQSLDTILNFVDDEFILVLDDANFDGVVESIRDFINSKKLDCVFERVLLTEELEDEKSWWNGVYLAVLRK